MELTLYHGTRVSEEQLKKEGLKMLSVKSIMKDLCGRLRIPCPPEPIPSIAWLMSPRERAIHLTASWGEAAAYSAIGPTSLMEVYDSLLGPASFIAGDEALKGKIFGKSKWVVTVTVPSEWIANQDRVQDLTALGGDAELIADEDNWDFLVLRDIPPQRIVSIELVEDQTVGMRHQS